MSYERLFIALSQDENTPPASPEVEDLQVFSLNFSQVFGEVATVTARIKNPPQGIFNVPRFATLSAKLEAGGVEVVARGQIVGFPVALAGELIDIEILCRGANAKTQVDNLWSNLDGDVSPFLVDREVERRAREFSIVDVVHNPVTLTPSLKRLAGEGSAQVLRGESAPAGECDILSMSIDILRTPSSAFSFRLVAEFEESRHALTNIAGKFNVDNSVEERSTYTPAAFRSAVESVTLSGDYEVVSSDVSISEFSVAPLREFFTEPRKVDPQTCIVTKPKSVSLRRLPINSVDIRAIANPRQLRSESLNMRFTQDFGAFITSDDEEEETIFLRGDFESLIRFPRSFQAPAVQQGTQTLFTTTIVQEIPSSFFGSGFSFLSGAGVRLIVQNIFMRAARKMILNALCVQVELETTLKAARSVTLGGIVRVEDPRLPGGSIEGVVYGIDQNISSSQTGRIVLRCAPSPSTSTDRRVFFRRGTITRAVNNDTSVFLEQLTELDEEKSDPVTLTTPLSLAISNSGVGFCDEFKLVNNGMEQLQELEDSGNSEESANPDPFAILSPTGFNMKLVDLSPGEMLERDIFLEDVEFLMPRGTVT